MELTTQDRNRKIEAMAKLLAGFEIFDWSTLPEFDPVGMRDRQSFRYIADQLLRAADRAS